MEHLLRNYEKRLDPGFGQVDVPVNVSLGLTVHQLEVLPRSNVLELNMWLAMVCKSCKSNTSAADFVVQ